MTNSPNESGTDWPTGLKSWYKRNQVQTGPCPYTLDYVVGIDIIPPKLLPQSGWTTAHRNPNPIGLDLIATFQMSEQPRVSLAL